MFSPTTEKSSRGVVIFNSSILFVSCWHLLIFGQFCPCGGTIRRTPFFPRSWRWLCTRRVTPSPAAQSVLCFYSLLAFLQLSSEVWVVDGEWKEIFRSEASWGRASWEAGRSDRQLDSGHADIVAEEAFYRERCSSVSWRQAEHMSSASPSGIGQAPPSSPDDTGRGLWPGVQDVVFQQMLEMQRCWVRSFSTFSQEAFPGKASHLSHLCFPAAWLGSTADRDVLSMFVEKYYWSVLLHFELCFALRTWIASYQHLYSWTLLHMRVSNAFLMRWPEVSDASVNVLNATEAYALKWLIYYNLKKRWGIWGRPRTLSDGLSPEEEELTGGRRNHLVTPGRAPPPGASVSRAAQGQQGLTVRRKKRRKMENKKEGKIMYVHLLLVAKRNTQR